MSRNKDLVTLALFVFLTVGFVPSSRAAGKFRVLHRFNGRNKGWSPMAGLVLDAAGNLYGTTYEGGLNDGGTVFKLDPNADGSWTQKVLHSFARNSSNDGSNPEASLVFDGAGNLYGTTVAGGSGMDGTVFQLRPNADGNWRESVLYSFAGGDDGAYPYCSLIFDAAGNLYGTTAKGGGSDRCTNGCGTIFELSPGVGGKWTETLLHHFGDDGGDSPAPELTFDAAGSLYGVAGGGTYAYGKVYKLKPRTDGSWAQIVLYNFTGGADGAYPDFGVIFDTAGNLYGTTARGGGKRDAGTVFQLRPNSENHWTESVLHDFAVHPGFEPSGGLIFDGAGNLYGTTILGGCVFELSPRSGGNWEYGVLHFFYGKPAEIPESGVVLDRAGNLYGTTEACGIVAGCAGVVYEITP